MTTEYTSAIALALRLIDRKGVNVIYRAINAGASVDPNKPWLGTTDTTTDFTVKGVILDIEESRVDGTVILQGDREVYIAAAALNRKIEQPGYIVNGSELLNIESVNLLSPANEDILFIVRVRG